MADPYLLLGISKKASAEEIKKTYRKLAKKYHPDLNPGNKDIEKKFKEITAAYELLSDVEKRARFDRGEIDEQGTQRAGPDFYNAYQQQSQDGYRTGGSQSFDFSDIFSNEDIFSRIFKQNGKASQYVERGSDVSYTLRINFLEAVLGTKRKISLSNGKDVSVTIPIGTEEGQILRLKGHGMKGTGGGPSGDVHLEIHIEPHLYFTRKGLDIYLDVPISLKESVMGEKIQVPTIHGPVMVTIPQGSETGQTLRLKGKGVALSKDKNVGDQYIIFKLMLTDPKDPNLQKFVKNWDETPSADKSIRKLWM